MVAPLLLLFIIGIFDIGRLVYINNALAQAAREGARYGSVQGRSSDPEAIRAHVLGAIAAVPAPVVNVTCSPTCRPGSTLAVEVETSVAPVTPLISQFVGPIDLSSTSTMGIHL
jgi:Flp pilus assembly protein TadG